MPRLRLCLFATCGAARGPLVSPGDSYSAPKGKVKLLQPQYPNSSKGDHLFPCHSLPQSRANPTPPPSPGTEDPPIRTAESTMLRPGAAWVLQMQR